MNFKDTIVGIGIAVAVAGIAMVVDPALASYVPTTQVFVLVAGVLILFQGVRIVRGRRRTEFSEAETPDLEASLRVPTPGDDIDETLESVKVVTFKDTMGRSMSQNEVYRDLRSVAIETISQRMNCSEDEAVEMLHEGTWTDDQNAVAFFGADKNPEQVSLLDTLRGIGNVETSFQRDYRHAAYALCRLAEGEDDRR